MLEEKLRQARESFQNKLPTRLDELEGLLRQAITLRHDGGPPASPAASFRRRQAKQAGAAAALQDAQRLAHKLCGSAGTFGLMDVHALMQTIDRDLLAIVQAPGFPEPSFFDKIAAEINKARRL